MRDEVNTCFSEILHEIKQLQMKVLDFVEKEEATALGKLGNSIQQSHNRLLKLEGDSVWLHSLLTNRSDEQFLQARPPLDQALQGREGTRPRTKKSGCGPASPRPLSLRALGQHPKLSSAPDAFIVPPTEIHPFFILRKG